MHYGEVMKPIDITDLPPLLISKTKSYYYVMTYKNVWDNETKRSKRIGSKKVGVYDPNTQLITFSDAFLAQYPMFQDVLVYKRGKGKDSKYEFKRLDEEENELFLQKVKSTVKLHAGATYVFNNLIAQTPIGRALNKVFPTYSRDKKILSLVYFLAINRDNALFNYEEFAECTWLPYQRPLKSNQISALLKSITKNDVEKFFKHLNAEYDKAAEQVAPYKNRYLALDSTSISTQASNISQAEYGHNKDGDDTPQVNLLMLAEQRTGLPLYYRHYDGSTPDISTVRHFIAETNRLELLNDVVYVADKGYMSVANIDDCLRNNMHFILNTKVSANALIKSAIDEAYNELISPNTLSAFLNQNVVTTELNWRYDEFPIDGKRAQYKGKETLFAHIYYNRTINHNFYSALSHNLARIKEKYMRGESLMPVEQQYFNDYLIVNEETNTVSIDMVKFNEKTKYSGIRVLITDTVKCPIETHQAYDERNQVEYAFNTFKSRLKCFRLRCHTNATLEGKLFIQVLACSLAIMVRNRLAEYKEHTLELKKTISKDFNFIYDSDHKVLAKLNNLQLTKFTNGFYFDEIVGVKKNLLLALGVPLPTAKIDEDEAVLNDTDPVLSQTDEFDFCEY